MITVTAHEKNLRALRCMVSWTDQDIELHHCHGGSMLEIVAIKGTSMKTNPFFQIPLAFKYHRGEYDIEQIGVAAWEEKFGTQLSHLQRLEDILGYNVFIEAGSYDARQHL